MAVSAREVVRNWGEYMDRVMRGEAIDIVRHGRPAVRLTRIERVEPDPKKAA